MARINLTKAANNIPWNFNSHLQHAKVLNLSSPLEINAIISNEEAVSLFKDYTDAIANNDIDSIADHLEPSFYVKALKSVKGLHKEMGVTTKLK